MNVGDLRKMMPALGRFVRKFDSCIKTRPGRKHFRTYVLGQLGPLERKSVEPIALEAGVAPRTLQEFLSIHSWDEAAVGRRLRALIRRKHGEESAIGVIDETSFAKQGTKTAGVQRQHCGSTGKTDNCVVTVHLGYVTPDFHALLDGELYLPQSWTEDPDRRLEAGIPAEVVFKPKWRIALELLERSLAEKVPLRWVTADEEYGRVGEFRDRVAGWGLCYVVEIPSNPSAGSARNPKPC